MARESKMSKDDFQNKEYKRGNIFSSGELEDTLRLIQLIIWGCLAISVVLYSLYELDNQIPIDGKSAIGIIFSETMLILSMGILCFPVYMSLNILFQGLLHISQKSRLKFFSCWAQALRIKMSQCVYQKNINNWWLLVILLAISVMFLGALFYNPRYTWKNNFISILVFVFLFGLIDAIICSKKSKEHKRAGVLLLIVSWFVGITLISNGDSRMLLSTETYATISHVTIEHALVDTGDVVYINAKVLNTTSDPISMECGSNILLLKDVQKIIYGVLAL